MNIEEARNVLWLKSNHRPLGELLDEGYLTRGRLEWAAQWAYNSKLQQAARVILQSIIYPSPNADSEEKPVGAQVHAGGECVEVGISLEEARSTAWPFAPYKGQCMGSLVESRQLSLKDLGYAIENAWDEKVRQAAKALSLSRLNQIVKEPVPPAGFLHVTSGGRSYSERQQLRLALFEGLLFGCVLTLSLLFTLWMLISSFRPNPNARTLAEVVSSPVGIINLVIGSAIIIFLGWLIGSVPERISRRFEKKIEAHRRGQEGEEKVLQTILQALDGTWQLFRNIQLPGRNKGDLDLVLVGPPGVWVLEVKNFEGKYRNIGQDWHYRNGNNWKALSKNPGRQAHQNATRLAHFLRADRLKVFVNSVIVWANPESSLYVEDPAVAIWRYHELPEELGNIWQGEKLSEVECNKISEKLTRLCEQKKSQG